MPDETNGSLLTKTLPVRPHMTTRDVCKIIAHKLRITNPQDYSLFKLIDGQGDNYDYYFYLFLIMLSFFIIILYLIILYCYDCCLSKCILLSEFLLQETDCPQDIKSSTTACGNHCLFAYKRIDAKIAWPHSPSP